MVTGESHKKKKGIKVQKRDKDKDESPNVNPPEFTPTTEPAINTYVPTPPVSNPQIPVEYLTYSTANKLPVSPHGVSESLRREGLIVNASQLWDFMQISARSTDPRAEFIGQLHGNHPERSQEELTNNLVVQKLTEILEELKKISDSKSRDAPAAPLGILTPDLRRLITHYGAAGAREKFEELVLAILRVLVDNSIQGVKVQKGDKGIDAFFYKGENIIDIWQAKYFIDKFDNPQKQQVLRAYQSAISFCKKKQLTINNWVLVLPQNFDADGSIWWETWKEEQIKRGTVRHISELLKQDWLMYYNDNRLRPIIDKFLGLETIDAPKISIAESNPIIKEIDPRFKTFDAWSTDESITFPENYLVNKTRTDLFNSIRKLLREKPCSISRIAGISGIGKTRFAFELVNTDELKERVIYCNVENLQPSECTILMKGIPTTKIVVFDNCERIFFEELIGFYSGIPKNHIITISKFLEEDYQNVANTFVLQSLSIEDTNEIVAAVLPGIKDKMKEKIHNLSNGVPKFFIYILKLYQQTGTLINRSQFLETYFQKIITGTSYPEAIYWNRCKNVLMYIAIFDQIGFRGSSDEEHIRFSKYIGLQQIVDNAKKQHLLSEEGKWLSQKIDITWIEFQGEVVELQQKGILTIKNHIRIIYSLVIGFMVNQWWRQYGETALNLLSTIPESFYEDFRRKFFHMLFYAELGDDRIYSNILNLLSSVMLDKSYAELVTEFIFNRWNSLKISDRTIILRGLAGIEEFRVQLCDEILFDQYGEISIEEKERWLIYFMQFEDCLKNICESLGFLFQRDPKNPLYNHIFKKILESNLPRALVEILIVEILENINLLPEVAIAKLKLYSQDETFSLSIVLQLSRYVRNLDRKLFSELIENLIAFPQTFEGTILGGLILLLESYFDLFEESLARKIILKILDSERKSILITEIILNTDNQAKLGPEFVDGIRQKISRYKTPHGLACRKLLSTLFPYEIEGSDPAIVDQIIALRDDSWKDALSIFMQYLDDVKNHYHRDLQRKFKPEKIQLLLLAECLVQPINSFNVNWFYNPFSKTLCPLFVQIMPEIFPDYPENANPPEKLLYLKEFCKYGIYLDGVFPYPGLNESLKKIWFEKIYLIKLDGLITKTTPIIIIGEYLYQKIEPSLRQRGYNILNEESIVSPVEDNRNRFKIQFQNELRKVKLNILS